MAIGSILQIYPFDFKPSAPPSGQFILYAKTDNFLYLQDSSGTEYPFATTTAITQLVGEATAVGPGVATITLSNSAVIGKVLTGFTAGPNSPVLATDTILQAIQKLQAQTSAVTGTSLSGDVTGPFSATVVALVGGKTAAQVSTSVDDTLAATSINTASTIVKRDASGNFSANIITASLNGNATTSTNSTNFTGNLLGDVTGTQSATVVSSVGGESAADVAQSVNDTQNATSSNTASTIVKRDASGDFDANVITADLIGDVTGDISGTASNVTGIVAIANGGTNSSTPLNNNRVMKSSGGAIIEAAAITANRAIISDVNGIPTHSVTTDTEISYVSGATSNLQDQIDAVTGSGITALTGDVSATGPGSVPATVNSVGGSSAANINSAELAANAATSANTPNTIVKRDGSGNFSAGTITANLTGLVNGVDPAAHASRHLPSGADPLTTAAPLANLSATTTNAVGTANSLARSDHSHAISTGAPSTQIPDQSNNVGSSANLARADHIHNIPSGVPVQIGTSNVQGSSASFSLSDHIHAHGNQTSGTLHAAATTSVNGFMSAADKVKIDYFSGTAGTNNQILISDGTTYNPRTMSGDATIANTGVITVSTSANFSGSLSGDVTGTQSATVIATGAVTDTKASLAVKPAITVVATTNQALTGTPTIDGQATAAGSLILLTAQSTGSQNGPWVAAVGAWSRPTWYPSGGTTQSFQFITTFVRLGTVYQGSVWRMTTAGAIIIDTTTTTWVVTPVSGNFKASYVVGPQTGSAEVDVVFANANRGTLGWNPGSNFSILLPTAQGAAGTVLTNDGTGQLSWSNPNTNIDGGRPDSVYTPSQFITGGTP